MGGRNTLLAFYDYRKSERNADAYAAKEVGQEALWKALYRLFELRAGSPAGAGPALVRHPGIINPESFSE